MWLGVLAIVGCGATEREGSALDAVGRATASAERDPRAAQAQQHRVWSRTPAASFVESYPLGDGRLGASWFGGVRADRLVLNENSMWSGSPQEADREGAAANLPAIRELLAAGRNVEAERLVNQTFTCQGAGSGHGAGKDVPYGCYQLLAELTLEWSELGEPVSDYVRELVYEASGAVQRVSFVDARGARHRRELRIDDERLSFACELEGAARDVRIALARPERAQVEASGREIALWGALNDGHGGAGVRYRCVARVSGGDGRVEAQGADLWLRGTTRLELTIGALTDFAGLGQPLARERDLERELRAQLDAPGTPADDAAKRSVRGASALPELELDDSALDDTTKVEQRNQLLRESVEPASGAAQLSRVGADRERERHYARLDLPTVERLVGLAQGANDPQLFALYFRHSLELLRGSSRAGSLPANLQGLWAPELQTPWNGDWHLNVNVQMNYWPALPAGLFDEHLPLVDLAQSLERNGARTAKLYYDAPGWVAHTITNAWGFTSPGEVASWGSSNTCSGWLVRALFEHYAFTQDRAFLERVHPTLRGAARFYLHILAPEPRHGWLVTPVSNSPENAFRMANGEVASVCMGPTIDQQIVRELFGHVIESARTLGRDLDLALELERARGKLVPHQIGRHGQLQEWLEDYDEPEPHHRHVSHLYGLYPGDQITPHGTPELARAARVTLERRGDDGTGWSLAHKANLWARLGEGNRAHALLVKLLRPVGVPGFEGGHGGTYANLFCAHPPFQIDGNFGGAAAIAEMLVQSHREREGEPYTLHLLPALPSAWPTGSVRGLFARGGLALEELRWREGRFVQARVRNATESARRVRLRIAAEVSVQLDGEELALAAAGDGRFEFDLPAGRTANLRMR